MCNVSDVVSRCRPLPRWCCSCWLIYLFMPLRCRCRVVGLTWRRRVSSRIRNSNSNGDSVGNSGSRANQTFWHYQRNWSSSRKLSSFACRSRSRFRRQTLSPAPFAVVRGRALLSLSYALSLSDTHTRNSVRNLTKANEGVAKGRSFVAPFVCRNLLRTPNSWLQLQRVDRATAESGSGCSDVTAKSSWVRNCACLGYFAVNRVMLS